jgi:hypothetical protein
MKVVNPSFFFQKLPSLLALLLFSLSSCTLIQTRPIQKMADTSAAIKAAREVQAETLAPELFRQAGEWFFKAKKEYRLKNFDLANLYADKARFFAESAEFEAVRNGAQRTSDPIAVDPLASPNFSSPAGSASPPPSP